MALCADSWGLKEGQQIDGDEESNYRHRPRPKSGAEEKRGGGIRVTEGLWWSDTVTSDYEWIRWHNLDTQHTAL